MDNPKLITVPLKLGLAAASLLIGLRIFISSYDKVVVRQSVDIYNSQQQDVLVPIPEPGQSLLRWGGILMAIAGTGGFTFLAVEDAKKISNGRTAATNKTEQRVAPAVSNRTVVAATPATRQVQDSPAQIYSNPTSSREPQPDRRAAKLPIVYAEQELESPTTSSDSQREREEVSNTGRNPNQAQRGAKQDKFARILQLINEPTLIICGGMGSGKTSKGGYLAAQHLIKGHYVLLVNPLAAWKFFEGIKTFGKGEDYKDAAEGIKLFVDEANRRLKLRGTSDFNPLSEPHLCLICDEMTNWEAKMPPDVMADLIEVCTQKLRQANMSVVFTSHGTTLTCLGGKQAGNGKSDVIKRQFKQLRCIAKSDPNNSEGGLTCAGYAYLEWLENNQEMSERITIPVGTIPPNKQVTANGLVWYDFQPLLPPGYESFVAELEEEEEIPDYREHTQSQYPAALQNFAAQNNLTLDNFTPPTLPDEWEDNGLL